MATKESSKSSSYINRNGLSTDVYELANYVNKVKERFTPEVDEDTLMLGIFGYFGSLMSDMFQNDIIMAAEFANESIPTRAKFDKNIIAHALSLNFTAINATPARMDVIIAFLENEIVAALGGGSGEFKFDCDNKIYFGNLEFHPDYDIIIKRIRLRDGSFTYAAMYDMTSEGVYDNPVSDITNPYLTPPVVVNYNGTRYLYLECLIRQVEKTTMYKKVLSDNTISSKTVNFEFESQMAAFTVDVKVPGTNNVHLVPVYEGLDTTSKYSYIWFTYLDTSTIRLKFDRDSYSPRVNADITVNVQTTQGEAGNFTWNGIAPEFSFDSERCGYSNITCSVTPLTNESLFGVDKKSIKQLKQIIPREALARGSITNTKDLENYFNAIDTDDSQMYLYKKRDNNMERLYYTYMVMRDAYGNVMPTNTINLMLRPDQLYTDTNRARLILKKGQIIHLSQTDKSVGFISRFKEGDKLDYLDNFYYTIPYNFAICMDPMYGIYFLTTMDEKRGLTFSYINEECLFQYIATNIRWTRNYLEDDDKYTGTVSLLQNFTGDDSMITLDENGEISESKIRCIMVLYDSESMPYRWAEAKIVDYNKGDSIITFEFTMKSRDYIDGSNRIRIEGIHPCSGMSAIIDYGYMPSNCKAMIHILTKQPEYSTSMKYRDLFNNQQYLDRIVVQDFTDWCVSNSYTINSGINFFYDYSEIIYSTISVKEGEYIPPDEEDYKPRPPEDYVPGGDKLEDDPNDKTLATEAAVVDAIRKALFRALGFIPRFHIDENGTVYLEDTNRMTYANVAHDNPTMATGEPGEDLGFPGGPVSPAPYPDSAMLEVIMDGIMSKIKSSSIYSIEQVDDKENVYEILIKQPTLANSGFLNEMAGIYGVTAISATNGTDVAYYKAGEKLNLFNNALDAMLPRKNGEEAEIIITINPDYVPPKPGTTEEPDDPNPTPPDDPEPPVPGDVADGKLIIGGANIDPDHANAYTIATEQGVYNLAMSMAQTLIDSAPRIIDQGNGHVSLTSPIMGSGTLGCAGDEYVTPPTADQGTDDNETELGNPDHIPDNWKPTIGGGGSLLPDGADDPNFDLSGDNVNKTPDGIGIAISAEEAKNYHFIVENVPVIRHAYFRTEDMVQFFCEELIRRKAYIDDALTKIEDTFGINFKFVNTYGPSRLFTLDNYARTINRVNVSLTFRIGLQVNYDPNIITYIKEDIKDFIEDINSITSIHMSNLVTEITSKYAESIVFFEFVDMNGYGTDNQHLYSMKMPDNVITPELININTLEDFTADITIIVA